MDFWSRFIVVTRLLDEHVIDCLALINRNGVQDVSGNEKAGLSLQYKSISALHIVCWSIECRTRVCCFAIYLKLPTDE